MQILINVFINSFLVVGLSSIVMYEAFGICEREK